MTHDLPPERMAEIKRYCDRITVEYERIMTVYVPAIEAYEAALRALYPPPVIITTDRTSPHTNGSPPDLATTLIWPRS